MIDCKLSICSLEESLPVFFIQDFTQHVMHIFALSSQLTSILSNVRFTRVIIRIEENWISSPVPEEVLYEDKFSCGDLYCDVKKQ